VEKLAADQHAANFVGARADLVQLGVAPQAILSALSQQNLLTPADRAEEQEACV